MSEDYNTINKSSSKSSQIYLDDSNASEYNNNRFHRQLSKEEKLYNRDMTTYLKKVYI